MGLFYEKIPQNYQTMKQRITKISAKQTDCKRKQMFCGLRNGTEIFLLLSFYRAVVIGDLQVVLSNSNPPFLQQEFIDL